MKVGRYQGSDGAERLGAVLQENGLLQVLDLFAAASAHGAKDFPGTMDVFIAGGERDRKSVV